MEPPAERSRFAVALPSAPTGAVGGVSITRAGSDVVGRGDTQRAHRHVVVVRRKLGDNRAETRP
jgi:hypothetical protein